MDPVDLYRRMVRARAFELGLADLWRRGLVSGELHLGTGEEALAAGVTAHLGEGDAVAVDHRSTPVLAMVGVDLRAMAAEALGSEEGLCRGRGGHMHLLCKDRLAVSSGIVGSSGPLAAGFALAARQLRPGRIAVAFFGEGAANQGMLLESWNLAAAWRLPLLFVCKDNGWAVTTRSAAVTGGDLLERARGFGLAAAAVDGSDPAAVFEAAAEPIARARRGKGASLLLARCPRLDGHMLGDPMVKTAASPMAEGSELFSKVLSAALSREGGSLGRRASSLAKMMTSLVRVRGSTREGSKDPVVKARAALLEAGVRVERVEAEVLPEVEEALRRALEGAPGGGDHADDGAR